MAWVWPDSHGPSRVDKDSVGPPMAAHRCGRPLHASARFHVVVLLHLDWSWRVSGSDPNVAWVWSDSHGPSRVDKDSVGPPMAAPIRRMFYLSSDGTGQEHEVFPQANRRVLSEIAEADAILYGIGSLYTSICPSLILAVSSPFLSCISFAGDSSKSAELPSKFHDWEFPETNESRPSRIW